ncbi:D-alanine--poly(phosphoribitol) ligase [Streptomyces sp. URMC 123]|uniref:D-alanine--poly(phosphoribitol) ligase n=1 Tax=Streptomyces sp. URMC 123 TaxID=3423403 RepID=UPI003F1B64B5
MGIHDSDTALVHLPRLLSAEHAARPALIGDDSGGDGGEHGAYGGADRAGTGRGGRRGGTVRLTYGELAARVDALSSRLLDLEARVGDRVAIWMDKGPRYAEAILASLQAGCVYVPLDGGQPAARVGTILADAEPIVLFTDRRHLAALDGRSLPATVRTVVVAGAEEDTGQESPGRDTGPVRATGHAPPARVVSWSAFTGAPVRRVVILPTLRRSDLAALLYTSGSTGTPKGVKISHGNLANFIGWAREEFAVGPEDVFANHASFNFDLSTLDLFLALSVGAAVWIVPDHRARDVVALARGIRDHGVTVWYSVPSILRLLTVSGALAPEVTARLRYVLFAGEVFPLPHLRDLAARLPERTALYNLYGPTETNVCTYHRVRPEDLAGTEPVPIGSPIGGARVFVLDEDGREVGEPGAVGELVVEGACVTPGYWRRESEPAAADHRRGRHPTGDLVSRERGELVYRGRKDRMVKLSGYRVELGEVEAAVVRHPGIAEAAVVLRGEGREARLALYYTLRAGSTRRPSLIEIKRHCAQHLPGYMLPGIARCLAELPRNANGKTDYRRLAGAGPLPAAAATAGPRPGEPRPGE